MIAPREFLDALTHPRAARGAKWWSRTLGSSRRSGETRTGRASRDPEARPAGLDHECYFCDAGQCGFCLPGLHCFEPGPGGAPNADPTAERANALASTIAVSFRFMGLLSRN